MRRKKRVQPEKSIRAYVDGSYRKGKSGYGVVLLIRERTPQKESNQQMFLYGGFESDRELWQLTAELNATLEAIDFALNTDANEITIYYDCDAIAYWARKSSLALALKKTSPIFEAYNRYIRKARKTLKIEFQKVPAHKGHELNNLADALAKHGRSVDGTYTTPSNPVPHVCAKHRYQTAHSQRRKELRRAA